MVIYSHSRLSSFEQCPRKFKYRYIDKIPPEFKMSIEAHLGKSVHDTLEWIYNSILKNNPAPTIEQMINYYAENWSQNFTENMKIVKKPHSKKLFQ